MELTWPSLRAWATDESLLAPVGLHRGFVRVETAQWDGQLIANDQLHNVSLSTAGADVSVAPSLHGTAHRTASHFVHLASSYQAMWVASRMQLALWMRGPEWGAAQNGYTDNPGRTQPTTCTASRRTTSSARACTASCPAWWCPMTGPRAECCRLQQSRTWTQRSPTAA